MKEITAEDHIANCFKKFATFEGSANREEFWYFFLFYTVAQVASYFADLKIFDVESGFGIITILVTAALFLPMLSVGARRLHDINKSGWWQLLMITGIGSIPLLIMWAMEGNIKSKKTITSIDKNNIQIFDMVYHRKDYVNSYLPAMAKDMNELIKKSKPSEKEGMPKNFKFKFESSSKYWSVEKIYPVTEKEFIEEFFKDRKLDRLEGVWHESNWGSVGIIKERSFYQIYDVYVTEKSYDARFKTHNDFSFASGTKAGVLIPTSDKKKFKLIGRVTIPHRTPPQEGKAEMTYLIQNVNGEATIKDDYYFKILFSGYENRIMEYRRVWPLNLEEHNKEFKTSSKSDPKINKDNIADQLKKLKELYQDGTLSKEEFTKAKNKLLK